MKKLLALLLAAMMTMGCLAGCGGDKEQDAKSDPEAPKTADEEKTAADGSIGTAEAPVEVKIVIKDVFPDEEDAVALAEAIEEKMAAKGQYVDIIFMDPPASGYASAMPIAVMNGEVEADIIYLQGGDRPLADQGLLVDLTPYIQATPDVQGLMDESNKVKLESYPYLLWLSPPRVQTPVVRTDVLSKIPSYETLAADPTIENYHTFMKELKEKGGFAYAMTFYEDTQKLDSIFDQAFGVTGTCMQEDGKWIFSKVSQAEKEKLAFYAQLYKEGLIDPDFLTNTWDVVEQKFYEGKAGVICGTAGSVIQVYDTKMISVGGPEAALTVLPPASGKGQSYTVVDTTKESRGFAINIDSENKDAAWAVLAFMASPEGRILDKVGVEGRQYDIKDGKIVFTDKFPGWWARFWETTRNLDPENALAEPVLTPAASKSLEMAEQYMVLDHNLLIPEEMVPQWDAMNNLYNEYATDIIRGVKPIEAFDELVQRWNEAGGNDLAPILAETFG